MTENTYVLTVLQLRSLHKFSDRNATVNAGLGMAESNLSQIRKILELAKTSRIRAIRGCLVSQEPG